MFVTTFALTALLAAAPASQPSAAEHQTSNSHMNCHRCEMMRTAGASAAKYEKHGASMVDAMAKPHSPTNQEINAAETGNPDSVDYGKGPAVATTGNVNADWEALEAGTPHNPRPGTATLLEQYATTPPPVAPVPETKRASGRRCC